MKPNEKPLLINLDRNVHFAVKMAAAEKNMSMKSWLMLAIAKALQEQKEEINRG